MFSLAAFRSVWSKARTPSLAVLSDGGRTATRNGSWRSAPEGAGGPIYVVCFGRSLLFVSWRRTAFFRSPGPAAAPSPAVGRHCVGCGRLLAVAAVWCHLNEAVSSCLRQYLRHCLRQCNVIAALRLRRATQIVSLYSNLGYDLQTLARLVGRVVGAVGRVVRAVGGRGAVRDRSVFALLSGAAAFNWEENKIREEQLEETADEIVLIRRTDSSSLMGVQSDCNAMTGWEKVIDKDNLEAYRKPLPNSNYLYEYKVFGTFHDIPARAFFNAQLDIESRRQWDRLVVKLEVIERDEESGTEVVHWITHFPYPMYQREYVYVRRALVDPKKKIMVIVSRSTEHPCCPITDKHVRVSTYMSNMVIRPHGNSFDENGFDYILTYHDDPQANFPTFAYNWMATTGVPDFVQKMHNAAKRLHESRMAAGGSGVKCQKDYQQTNPM